MVSDLNLEKFLNRLVGRKDIEDALKRLDKLTQDEALMAAAQILKLSHSVEDKVKVVDGKVSGVKNKMEDVDDKMDIVLNGGPDVLATQSPILIAQTLARRKGCESCLR